MNPHADSVQQPSDEQLIDAWSMEAHGIPKQLWFTRKEVLALLARFGTRPAAEPVLPDDFISSVKRLAFAARTSGGTAGRDDGLCRALDRVEAMLEAIDLPEWQAMASQRSAAEPSQSGSAGEADWSKIESIVDEFVDGYEMIGETADGRDACYTPNERERLLLRDCIAGLLAEPEFLAALSRQAPAAPAAVDFEKWWLAEVAANGGVPVGADYKHWAKKGFELRGEAEAMALLGWTRYEKARKLNPAQWAELHQRNLRGENFDDMIDALPATTQPVQQAAPTPAEPAQQDTKPAFWVLTEQLRKRETTHRGYLWFVDPQNSSWTPVYLAAPSPEAEPQDTVEALMAMTEEEVDAELRALGMEPEDALRRGTNAIEGALAAIRATPPAEKQAAPSGEGEA
jgi:hypothetical protein